MPQKTAATSPRVRELTERLEHSPGPRVFMELAKEHQAAGELEEAARVCRQGLERHPSYHSARVLLARVLIDLERFAEAVPERESVVRQAPDNLLARRLLGEAQAGSGDREGALKTLRDLLLLNPDDGELASRIQGLESVEAAPAPPAEVGAQTMKAPPPTGAEPAVGEIREEGIEAEEVAEAVEEPRALTPEAAAPEAAEPEVPEPPAVEEPEAVPPTVALEPPTDVLAEKAEEPVSAEAVETLEEAATEPPEVSEKPTLGEPEEVVAEAAEPEVEEPPAVEEPEAVPPTVTLAPPSEEGVDEVPLEAAVSAEAPGAVRAKGLAGAPPEPAPEFRTVTLSPASLGAEALSEVEHPPAEPRAEALAPAGEEAAQRTEGKAGALPTPTLAEIYYQQGLPEKAAETYERVLAGDPHNEEVRSRLREIRSELPRAASTARRKIRALETWLGRIRRSRNAQDRA
jgi:tetratricopeptide (TPR) repeat protein